MMEISHINPLTPLILKFMDLHHYELNPDGAYSTGRFRNIWISEGGSTIVLYAKNGGENRRCWELSGCPKFSYLKGLYYRGLEQNSPDKVLDPYKPVHHDPECMVHINWRLSNHPGYLSDSDDPDDNNYVFYEFITPDELVEVLEYAGVTMEKALEIQGYARRRPYYDYVYEVHALKQVCKATYSFY
jgi:hypothetical protein